MITSTDFKLGMRRLVSGVSLITTVDDGTRFGTIVTSVSSVSAEPPTLLCCLGHSNSCHDAVARSGVFCVNMLGRESEEISVRFAAPSDRVTRFDVGGWTRLVTGAPVLVEALVNFDCRVVRKIEANTHTVFLAEIEGSRLTEGQSPLLYGNGSYGDFAPARA